MTDTPVIVLSLTEAVMDQANNHGALYVADPYLYVKVRDALKAPPKSSPQPAASPPKSPAEQYLEEKIIEGVMEYEKPANDWWYDTDRFSQN